VIHAAHGVGRELEASGIGIAVNQSIQTRLMDWHLPALEALDLGRVDVDTEHVVTGIGQTRSGDQTDVARAEDRDSHNLKA